MLGERLRELSLIDVDVLLAPVEESARAAVLAAYVDDLEDAFGEARAALRDGHAALGAGPDPLLLVEKGSASRARGGDEAVAESQARLKSRAAARLALAQLEELVAVALPRLLEADRRLTAIGGD